MVKTTGYNLQPPEKIKIDGIYMQIPTLNNHYTD